MNENATNLGELAVEVAIGVSGAHFETGPGHGGPELALVTVLPETVHVGRGPLVLNLRYFRFNSIPNCKYNKGYKPPQI